LGERAWKGKKALSKKKKRKSGYGKLFAKNASGGSKRSLEVPYNVWGVSSRKGKSLPNSEKRIGGQRAITTYFDQILKEIT